MVPLCVCWRVELRSGEGVRRIFERRWAVVAVSNVEGARPTASQCASYYGGHLRYTSI